LHHSGIRPAPPSDHTPLARRSAFHRGESGPAREFERGRGVEINLSERISALPCARGRYFFVTWNHGTLRFHPRYCRGDAGDSHEPQRRGIYPDQVGNSGVLAVAIPDRRPRQIGKDRGKACPVGHAPRPVEDRSRTKARDAPIDVLIGFRAVFPAPLSAADGCPSGT